MNYVLTDDNLLIKDSYKVKKKDMEQVLFDVIYVHPKSNVWQRSMDSLCDEWAVHNACYNLHILRSHTADVDLNFPNRFEWVYRVLAPFARLIID